jgi:hypothetical protein
METIDIQHQQLSRSRRNSIQPIDRHINEIHFDGTIYINAGIDSTWLVLFINIHFENILSLNYKFHFI